MLTEKVIFFSSAPHHVTVQGRQTQVYDLAEVFVYRVDSLLSCRSDLVPKVINNAIDFFIFLFQWKFFVLEDTFQVLDQLMSACSESTHCFVLINDSVKVIFGFFKFFFPAE